jgi:hypothetical protein
MFQENKNLVKKRLGSHLHWSIGSLGAKPNLKSIQGQGQRPRSMFGASMFRDLDKRK